MAESGKRGRIKKQRAGDADPGSTFRRTEPFSGAVGVEPLQITKQTNLKPIALVGGACVIAASSRFFPLLSSSAGAGIWAALPVIFSVCYTSGIVHSVITTILAVTTVSTFGLAAFRCAGAPPMVVWGSYTVVGKGDLKNYTFCRYCSKPKSPRAHHCRSCGMCILDMDHHCPFVNRELCWRSESSAFHRFPNFSYFEFNLRFGDLCVCEFPYLAAIGIQNPPPLGIIHHSSVDPRDKGSNSGFDKIRHGAFSQGTRSRLPVFCERFGGDQFDRSSMAETVLHLRRPNLSQPFEFSGRRSSGHRERLPEPCTVLRLSMFDFEILAHPAKFAKEAQEVNKFVVLAFLSYTHIYN
ncbi:hypothetical protein V6N11_010311 [Hibiscus sabdariffa]|uniref:S-acyltransferase n=1 Tax=Hibiscus sabdariffa TaxID=183260 RepID=A0ABR2PE83_9ROSI